MTATTGAVQSAIDKLALHTEVWKRNAILRATYQHYYDKIIEWLPQQSSCVIEVGGGIGNFKERFPKLISSDIVPQPWADVIMDAQCLPFPENSVDAVTMIDVLHHLECPSLLFEEMQRVLKPGGRLLILDVFVSPVSYAVLKLLHPEPVVFGEDFLNKRPNHDVEKDPWDANQAMATQIFWQQQAQFFEAFPKLSVPHKECFDWSWPLSGGFSYPALLPQWMAKHMKSISQWKWMNKLSAFRSFVVIEKQIPSS